MQHDDDVVYVADTVKVAESTVESVTTTVNEEPNCIAGFKSLVEQVCPSLSRIPICNQLLVFPNRLQNRLGTESPQTTLRDS